MPIKFNSSSAFQQRVDAYFDQFNNHDKVTVNKTEVPTFCGLLLYLGFNSREEFIVYEQSGRFNQAAKRARLQIEAEYEKRLHLSSSTGAVFALRTLGWGGDQASGSINISQPVLQIEIQGTGFLPAGSETQVDLT
ncbi:DNA-packaging protein [Mucilaginibacter roseus]|uniref:DNA-packaging protein n=1 Tax=Mucilaginibacter roseus TaxID=1528868 RepID=A0ABS8U4E7_9SPHI|nr:DNA-packaging protein [Mucilaginibacter roseus]MCD8740393.1 DNA-packaging protein [Mucilaginibacter roseus]